MGNVPRGLAAALSMTPEVRRFIEGEDKSSQPATSDPHVVRKPSTKTERSIERSSKSGGWGVSPDLSPRKANRRAAEPAKGPSLSQARVAVTTRFKQEVADSLRRSSLERKLRGESPHSQQDIIELAVAAWLQSESKQQG